MDGPIQDVVSSYRARLGESTSIGAFHTEGRRHSSWAEFRDVRLVRNGARVGAIGADEDLEFEFDVSVKETTPAAETLRGLVLEVVLVSEDGKPLMSLMNVDGEAREIPATRTCTVRARLAGPTLVPGRYRMNVLLGWPYLSHVDVIVDAMEFDITPPGVPWRPYPLHQNHGPVCRLAQWSCR